MNKRTATDKVSDYNFQDGEIIKRWMPKKLFFFFCLLLFILIIFYPRSFMSAPEKQTRINLRSIQSLMNIYGYINGSKPYLISAVMKEKNINAYEAFFSLLQTKANLPELISENDYQRIIFLTTNWINPSLLSYSPKQIESLKVDGWGNPVHIDFATNIFVGNKTASHPLDGRSILFWSDGPNQRDEQCAGDDIVLWLPLPTDWLDEGDFLKVSYK